MGLMASLGVDVFNHFASFGSDMESETVSGVTLESSLIQQPLHQVLRGSAADRD